MNFVKFFTNTSFAEPLWTTAPVDRTAKKLVTFKEWTYLNEIDIQINK